MDMYMYSEHYIRATTCLAKVCLFGMQFEAVTSDVQQVCSTSALGPQPPIMLLSVGCSQSALKCG